MAPPNLTRVDAERRAALLDVTAYTVELDLTDGSGAPGETTFATTARVQFTSREPGAIGPPGPTGRTRSDRGTPRPASVPANDST